MIGPGENFDWLTGTSPILTPNPLLCESGMEPLEPDLDSGVSEEMLRELRRRLESLSDFVMSKDGRRELWEAVRLLVWRMGDSAGVSLGVSIEISSFRSGSGSLQRESRRLRGLRGRWTALSIVEKAIALSWASRLSNVRNSWDSFKGIVILFIKSESRLWLLILAEIDFDLVSIAPKTRELETMDFFKAVKVCWCGLSKVVLSLATVLRLIIVLSRCP